ncbi:MAG: hypothetical protein EA411_10070 [Saprospirales bacterium]|nr:MAG: hypothetical protein EA411_10070 [Saprospirales bacterium]
MSKYNTKRFIQMGFYRISFLLAILFLCGTPKLQSQERKSFEFEGLDRNFLVKVPEKMYSESGYPVVVALHGFTQSARRISNYSGFVEMAEEEGFIAVFPQGIQASWNFGITLNDVDDVAFLSSILDSLEKWYPVDSERIYFCGFSNGAFMSFEMACRMSHRIAAIASVGGSMGRSQFLDCEPEYPVGVMIVHGNDDRVILFEGQSWVKQVAEVTDHWVLQNGCNMMRDTMETFSNDQGVISVVRISHSPCQDQTAVELWKVYGGGHTWPGSRAHSGSGRTNRDIDASAKMWQFFTRHKRANFQPETK